MTMLDIEGANYAKLTERAKKGRMPIKEYANDRIRIWLMKEDMLLQYAPNLSTYTVEEAKLVLVDRQEMRLVDIYGKAGTLHCCKKRERK